jgi:hypothetical protein
MLKVLGKYKLLIVLSLLFLFLRLPSVFEPYWYGDEGIYLTLGEGIRKGLVLYSQIHDNKPPTLYYLAAIGNTVAGFRILLFLWMIPTVYAFNLLAKKFIKGTSLWTITFLFVILSSVPFLEGNIANAEVFMLLPTILGVLFFLNAKKSLDYFLPTFLLGFAFTIKSPVLFEFGFLFLFLLCEKLGLFEKLTFKEILPKLRSHIMDFFYFILGFIFPITLWGIYFGGEGAFKPFLNASLLQNFGYLSSWSTGNHTSSLSSGGLMFRLVVLVLVWVGIYLLLLKKVLSKKIAFILFWFSTAIFGTLLSGRPYPHYLIQAIPSFCLLIVALVIAGKNKTRIIGIVSLLLFVAIVAKYKFYFYPVFSYYGNFYSYALHLKDKSSYYSYFGSNIEEIYAISDYVKTNTDANQKIFIWGDSPFIYALSNRLPVGRYTVAYHIVDFNAYKETYDNFKCNLPKLVIYYPMSGRSFPQLDNLLKRYYYPGETFGSVIVFKLR